MWATGTRGALARPSGERHRAALGRACAWALAAVAATAAAPAAARACDCVRDRRGQDPWDGAAVVFEARVARIVDLEAERARRAAEAGDRPPAAAGWIAHELVLDVVDTYRGRVDARVRLPIDHVSSCRVDWRPRPGTRVLVASLDGVNACRTGLVAEDLDPERYRATRARFRRADPAPGGCGHCSATRPDAPRPAAPLVWLLLPGLARAAGRVSRSARTPRAPRGGRRHRRPP